ncbi:MAG: VCBS repeat-containing protein [Bacteroidota bacterium]
MKRRLLVVLLLAVGACNSTNNEGELFTLMESSATNINFTNQLSESPYFNIIEYIYYNNGGGVATGDINNDGLVDVYFTSNEGENKLYLNKGDLKFEDISESAGVTGTGDWSTGVTMADVNADGLLDIYVCQLGGYKGIRGKNQLFINNGDLTFTDKALQYGLDFSGFSTHATFFDYDLDGDLDVFLLNHAIHTRRSYGDTTLRYERSLRGGDRLFRNDFDEDIPFFKDVTDEAGIFRSIIGYGLAATAGDINNDGCIDLYISNDFHEDDYLYINNCDGTFSEQLKKSLKHTSKFSMGNDIADFNNDGLVDIAVMDMLPAQESILKKSSGEETNEINDIKKTFGYYNQLARNTLQLNMGKGQFSDIALMTDVYATDWSWSPLLADFDNDGFKDMFVSNGIIRRPNDLDYINYLSNDAQKLYARHPEDSVEKYLISRMPSLKIPNFIFKNNGDLSFTDFSKQWNVDHPSFSNGAAYADLDNDGDKDLIINNINDEAFVYRNNSQNNYLRVKLKGAGKNTNGVGARVTLYDSARVQVLEQLPSRGFISSVDNTLTFGIGQMQKADSLRVIWPGGSYQLIKDIPVNQEIVVDQSEATGKFVPVSEKVTPFITEYGQSDTLSIAHQENEYDDFDKEYLMPHKLSTQGPGIAVGDINGDGLNDIYVCGANGQAGAIVVQNEVGKLAKLSQLALEVDKNFEDVDATFFDADKDGDVDLYVVSGGGEFPEGHQLLEDRLYLNDGGGNFSRATGSLAVSRLNGSCVTAIDYDNDGDHDLFVGSRSVPGSYGVSPRSLLLTNDGQGSFSPADQSVLPGLDSLGMVTDALWIDVDDNGFKDLIVVGEWMPITIFKNANGKFANATQEASLSNSNGWWNTITAADVDQDGDIDFIAGNLGTNSKLKASLEEPLSLYVKDFDQNGTIDPVLCYYKEGFSTPFPSILDMSNQIVSLRKRFTSFQQYAEVKTINDIFVNGELDEGVTIKKAFELRTSLIINNGDGTYAIEPLPLFAQLSPVNAIAVDDFNRDGHLDMLMAGNLLNPTINLGRYDASPGLLLLGDGTKQFQSLNLNQYGLTLDGEVRDLKVLNTVGQEKLILVGTNNEALKILSYKKRAIEDPL